MSDNIDNIIIHNNPSFSSGAKDGADKRFPEGTVDWYLSSDFNVEYNDVELLNVVAKGSYGTVYKAKWNNEIVAAKLENFDDGDEEQVNLLVELTMLQCFPHDRLVRFLGSGCLATPISGKIERKLMIVMELCERGALRECLHTDLPWNLRARIALDISMGISFLHDQQIIHRDIKSTNVLIDSEWRAKLCDFSFACHNESSSKKDITYGTDEFMAPEVACALDFDVSADIFSFGIVLCEIITGEAPSDDFMRRKPQDLFALNEKEVQAVILPDCPAALKSLAFLCCDIEPPKRPTAYTCINELSDVLETMGGAYFDYDETAALAGKTDPSPFREGKVRTSLGGPGHFNSSPFNRALRLPQYIAPPEEYKDLIINLEKQVAELKDENIRLKNIMLISSPAALYNEYGGPMGSKLSGLMSPTGKLIYESPHRKSPVKKNSTGNQDGEDEGENQNSHSTDHVNNDTTESNPTTARSTNQQNQHVEFSHHDQLESSSVPTIARPILNPTTATSQSMSPLAKKKSYMSALTSPLKRENKLVYQSLSPVRHSNSGHSVAPTVGPLDLQSDWAEDRQESNAELMVLLKTFQESLVKYGPSRHEAQLVLASIAKSIHVEDLLSPSIIPSVVTFSSATPIQLERGDNRHSNPTTAYGTPNSARNTWIDVCDTWSVNDNDNKETNRSPIQELAFPEVGSFGDSTMSKTVSPVRQVLTSSSYLSPMFESAILEDPSLTPVFVDRY